MWTCAILLAAAALASGIPLQKTFLDGRIVGGKNENITNVPYQVTILNNGRAFCGGSIIAPNVILTAGHCATSSAYYYQIRAGSNYSFKEGSVHQVSAVKRHEKYSSNMYGIPINDIALMFVKTPFEFDKTRQPVPLPKSGEQVAPGSVAVVTGFGYIRPGVIPAVLQTVSVPIVSKESCNNSYLPELNGIRENQICAAYPEGGKDACQGDSGGPLTLNGRQIGVVSWGKGCGLEGYPGVYTEVAAYIDWIQKHNGV